MKELFQTPILTEESNHYLWNTFLSHYANGFSERVKILGPQILLLFGSISSANYRSKRIETTNKSVEMPDFENEALANYYAEGMMLFTKRNDVPNSLEGM